jgi:hypothetical protein
MNFKNGDKVSILNESGVFLFIREQNNRGLIVDEHGFEREIDSRFLVKFNPIPVSQTYIKQEDEILIKKNEKLYKSIPEIDLHIEVLLDKSSHLSSHDKFLFQIESFKKFTNQMLQKRQVKFLVIHGAGEGKLKSEIRFLLNNKKGFRIHDENISEGKVGASLIEIFITEAEGF